MASKLTRARLADEAGLTLSELARWAEVSPRRLSRCAAGEIELTEDEFDRCLVVVTAAIRGHQLLNQARAYFREQRGHGITD